MTAAVALALSVNAIALSALVIFAARVRADTATRHTSVLGWTLTFLGGCVLLGASVISTLTALTDLIGA